MSNTWPSQGALLVLFKEGQLALGGRRGGGGGGEFKIKNKKIFM
jgi:hypothetical protein